MNFFKKYWIIISIILFFSIVIIIGLFKGVNETKQQSNQPLRHKHEIDSPQIKKQITNDKEPNQLSSDNHESETPKSKIKITQEKYNKIKSYILSENPNAILSLKDLSQEEINVIEKARNSHKLTLDLSKKNRKAIDENQEKCNNLISQRNSVINQIQQLQKQLQPKEAELETKNKEINKLKLKKQNKTTQLQTQGISTYNNNELNNIQKEISKLQEERSELIRKIAPINLQIGKLESKQTMYEGMLSNAVKMRDLLQRDYDKNLLDYKQSTLSSLNSLYEITSTEG